MGQDQKKEVDYMIVGDGFAAYFFAHQLIKNNKKFVLFSGRQNSASSVSAGIVNPVVLKKFTTFWLAKEQIAQLGVIMHEIEAYTAENYLIGTNIFRIFHDQKERELWQKKAQNEDLRDFLDRENFELEGVHNEFGAGRVAHSARINVQAFFAGMTAYLNQNELFVEELFDYHQLNSNHYQQFTFKNIVFCEGMYVRKNPFFHDIPVLPNKGHHLKVQLSVPLESADTIKKKHFLFPLSDGSYYYGGTYDRHDEADGINAASVEQLEKGLAEFYAESFTTEEVGVGMRPTVADRRPIIGAHPELPHYFVFNGLGARGVLSGSYFSQTLYEHIEHGVPLPPEVDLKRFN